MIFIEYKALSCHKFKIIKILRFIEFDNKIKHI